MIVAEPQRNLLRASPPKRPGWMIRSGPLVRPYDTFTFLLPCVHTYATVCALCGAWRPRLKRHKDVVVTGVGRDTVGIGVGSDILQPQVRPGIDDAKHRTVGHVSG